MILIIYLFPVICYSFAADTQETQETQNYYRISMVSSSHNTTVIYKYRDSIILSLIHNIF